MIAQIKDLVLPPQPAQHLSSGLAGQRVSVSVSQHITHTRVDNLPHAPAETHVRSWPFPTTGDILGAAGDGHAPTAALARCGQLMKAALCPLAGCSAGPSWETKWVRPQIKRPQTEL